MIVKSSMDLDTIKSIKELNVVIDTKHSIGTICTLIQLVQTHGTFMKIDSRDTGNIYQYSIQFKYLNNILPITFEFDSTNQYIEVIYYGINTVYLKIHLSIIDYPMIKYVHNDKSNIPGYSDGNITMKPGAYLMNFAHCLISFIGYDRVRLDDESHLIKSVDGIEIRTKLWLYLLVVKGRSWYAKFGYVPVVNYTEYTIALNDFRNVKLCDVVTTLNLSLINNTDSHFVENSTSIINLIGSSDQTMMEYTMSHTIDEFTTLTNRLTQSIYEKYKFPWYELYKRLLFANVMQINNCVSGSFYKLV